MDAGMLMSDSELPVLLYHSLVLCCVMNLDDSRHGDERVSRGCQAGLFT